MHPISILYESTHIKRDFNTGENTKEIIQKVSSNCKWSIPHLQEAICKEHLPVFPLIEQNRVTDVNTYEKLSSTLLFTFFT